MDFVFPNVADDKPISQGKGQTKQGFVDDCKTLTDYNKFPKWSTYLMKRGL